MIVNWIGWMLSAIVLLILVVAGAILLNPVRLLVTGQRTDGMVVGMESRSGLSGEALEETGKLPLIEFVTSAGERIRICARSNSLPHSAQMGEAVSLAYSRTNPHNVQILSLKEFPFGPAGIILGFAAFITLIWISAILISGDSSLDDPFHLLPVLISRFRLNPFRFPLLFILSVVIPVCGSAAFVFSKQTLLLHYNGIKAYGTVTGFLLKENFDNMVDSNYPEITFEDVSGKSHTILVPAKNGPLASKTKLGDSVEVIYLVSQPDRGKVNSWSDLYLYPLFFGCMTFAFLGLLRLILNGTIRL